MRIIFSPAKRMRSEADDLAPLTKPLFLVQAQTVLEWLQSLSYEEAKRLWKTSDSIAQAAYDALAQANLERGLVPAILSYDGIAFNYLAAGVLEEEQLAYLQDHLLILSGLYGALRPFDAVVPYRLEMQEKAQVAGTRSLYEYWGDAVYQEAMRGVGTDHVVVNLASKEYSRMVERYLMPQDRMVSCNFVVETARGLVQKGVYCKMARGEMVRYAAVHQVKAPEELKQFDSPDWRFAEELSTDTEFFFIRKAN
ncbi:peroxide stress protein YaaA [Olegusella massiliensis]|uniref:peroxide stress protein YaaA n=1 Tax=Olegusella massiliensis TaxID=1776381 RepID=UPI00405584F4